MLKWGLKFDFMNLVTILKNALAALYLTVNIAFILITETLIQILKTA